MRIKRNVSAGKSTIPIHKWPESERPRERLLAQGAEALATHELLAILVGCGGRGESALDVARSVLVRQEGNLVLADLNWVQLRGIRGIGPAAATRILAALELGRRLACEQLPAEIRLLTSALVADYVRPRLLGVKEERFLAIVVDVKNRPIALKEIARGGRESVGMSVRDFFREALLEGGSGVIAVHNHPSGDPTPSHEDFDLTRRLEEGARLIGVRFLDHIILAGEAHYSFAGKGG